MRLGWIVPHLGLFGSIREVIELSNAMVGRGHDVTIHHAEGTPCTWLPCYANVANLENIAGYDLLLLLTEWRWDDYQRLLDADARLKGVVLMGFTPSDTLADALMDWPHTPEDSGLVLGAALEHPDIIAFADGPWQLEWLREHVFCEIGVALGGINTDMFRPATFHKRRILLGASGDPRARKGTDTVMRAVELIREKHKAIEFRTYWRNVAGQDGLVEFLQETTIFLDGHIRAGWCNPVFEAMACGCAVVCTDIPAVTPLAVHGKTARVAPVGDAEAMAREACWLLADISRIEALRERAIAAVRDWDYRLVAERLERYMAARLDSLPHTHSKAR